MFTTRAALGIAFSAVALAQGGVEIPSPFTLQVEVTQGNMSYNGQYIVGFHTGAGLNAGVVASGIGDSFMLRKSMVVSPISGQTDSAVNEEQLALATTDSYPQNGAPKGYLPATLDLIHDGTKGFSFNSGGILTYTGNIDFSSFAVCYAKSITLGQPLTPEPQLLYVPSGASVEEGCAFVNLRAAQPVSTSSTTTPTTTPTSTPISTVMVSTAPTGTAFSTTSGFNEMTPPTSSPSTSTSSTTQVVSVTPTTPTSAPTSTAASSSPSAYTGGAVPMAGIPGATGGSIAALVGAFALFL